MTEYFVIAAFFGIPGLAGAWLATGRGKNPILWGLGAAVFPFVLVILWFHKPSREIPGWFKFCNECGKTYPWKADSCIYCSYQRATAVNSGENQP